MPAERRNRQDERTDDHAVRGAAPHGRDAEHREPARRGEEGEAPGDAVLVHAGVGAGGEAKDEEGDQEAEGTEDVDATS